MIVIENAVPGDAEAILSLLDRTHLPKAGLVDHLATTLVARRGHEVVGSAALEVYADGALLRSVAVDPGEQGTGLGRRITEAAIARALALGVPALYLLTTTAERFFPKFGFSQIDRRDVPASVQQSVEFLSACPASAVVMKKPLTRGPAA
jgi:amino-acid N-acetyltransferase